MLAEVLVRALSNVFPWVPADIPVAWEYSSYLMAATFTFGAAMTLRAGGHIRVTLVLARMSAAGAALDGDGAGGARRRASAASSPGRWPTSPGAASTSGQTSVSSGTLIWIPQAFVTFGIVLLTIQFVARFFQAALGLPLEDLSMRAGAVAE